VQTGWNQAVYMGLRTSNEFELLSHNMANANTPGFKQELTRLWKMDSPDPVNDLGQAPSYYLDVRSRDLTQGNLHDTGNETDLALEGPGYFKVQSPQGSLYTRNGMFRLNTERQLVTQQGYPVQGKNGTITLNANDQNYYIDEEGGIHMDNSLGDQLLVVDFPNPQGLALKGSNYYGATPESGTETPTTTTMIRQGEIEDSNFDPTSELVQLVNIQRSFEAYLKVLDTVNSNDQKAIEQIGNPA
jgi:flagellar basal-body rod protein FlgF